MKTNSTSLHTLSFAREKTFCSGFSFSGMLRGIFTSLILFICFNANAQSPPASNIFGPLKVHTTDTAVVITSQIAANSTPNIIYGIENNLTNAYIVSKGTFHFDGKSGIGTQTIIINPGTSKGSFNVSLIVTTPDGTCKSSKSVTVAHP